MIDYKLKVLSFYYFIMAVSCVIIILCNKKTTYDKKINEYCTLWNLTHFISRIIAIIFFKEYWKLILILDISWEICEYIYEEYMCFYIKRFYHLDNYVAKNIYDWNDLIWNILGMLIGWLIPY
jgi:hypothetical protein